MFAQGKAVRYATTEGFIPFFRGATEADRTGSMPEYYDSA
jgi:hypothetical protein